MDTCDTLVLAAVFPGVENYLPDYFNSLNKQTYSNIEIIIIDDGSVVSKDVPPYAIVGGVPAKILGERK